ncbi:MAG: CBU_0592 family membrane protein [Actinomycetota bacterium]
MRTAAAQAIRKDGTGYVATLAFLLAYALTVGDAAPMLAATLNVAGGLTAAFYLHGKGAVPSVISNLVWVVITLVGLVVG